MTRLPPPTDPAVHAARRARTFERLGRRALVLPASPPAVRSRDTEYRHRPDSELSWVTGLAEPDAVAVLRGHADDDRFVVFVRERDADAERWDGPRLGVDAAGERTGADAAYPIAELPERLPGLLHGADGVAYRLGEGRLGEDEVLAALRWARRRGPRTGVGPRFVVDPGEVLDDLRLVKDAEEVHLLRGAAQRTVRAFREIAPLIRAGVGEWELQGRLDGAFRALGGEGPAYESIIASGSNACVLHYVACDRRAEAGELVLIDAGAAWGGYAADLTRTFPVGGVFTGPGRAVYEIVERARAEAVAAVRPGVAVAAVHEAAAGVIREGLVELGVLEAAAASDPGAHRPWYPHQTSHWLGQDVHDVGDYAVSGESRLLEPGMVLTVEPGLYFPARDAEGPAAGFAGIGVRIEDDVLVTEGGREVLTAAFPTDPDEVAATVRRGPDSGSAD
jgi:Xaa-Pro aminopeptidase